MSSKEECNEVLLKACEEGNLEKVKELIDSKLADPRCEARNFPKQQPIHNAAGEGHVDIVEYLIEKHEVDVESVDKDGWTPLFCACDGGHMDVVEYLVIEKNANIAAKDESNETPLHHASAGGHLKIVRLLVERGAPLDVKNEEGKTPEECGSDYDEIKTYFESRFSLKNEISTMSLKEFENLKDLKNELASLKQRIKDYEEREKKSKEKSRKQKRKLKKLEKKLSANFEKEKEQQKSDMKKDFLKIMGEELKKRKDLAARLEEKERECVELQEKIRSGKVGNEDVKDSTIIVSELKLELSKMKASLKEKDLEIKKKTKLEETIKRLREDLEDQEEIEKLLEQKIKDLESENAELKSKLQEK